MFSTIKCSIVKYTKIAYITSRYSKYTTLPHSTVEYITLQQCIVQFNKVHYYTAQYIRVNLV